MPYPPLSLALCGPEPPRSYTVTLWFHQQMNSSGAAMQKATAASHHLASDSRGNAAPTDNEGEVQEPATGQDAAVFAG